MRARIKGIVSRYSSAASMMQDCRAGETRPKKFTGLSRFDMTSAEARVKICTTPRWSRWATPIGAEAPDGDLTTPGPQAMAGGVGVTGGSWAAANDPPETP